jgi:branched-chain amino acid aminotransferase
MSKIIKDAAWIWKNGDFVPWAEATLHILSTAVQFGSSVFEGIRCYDTARGPAIFRLPEHLRRLRNSCRIYRMDPGYGEAELTRACCEVVRRNALRACYIRPMVLRGYGTMAMDGVGNPIETYVPAWEWGAYLGAEALERGVDVCVSSWQRAAGNTFPGMAKAAGHYNNAQLIKLEALANGYVEAIALTTAGVISEGSGQNLFAVVGGELVTPPIEGSNLQGVTRASVMQIAHDLDIPVRESVMPREILYAADELFFTGTASEVTPIRSVDKIEVGEGKRGPVTARLQERFLAIVRGEHPNNHGWLTPVEEG